MGRRDGTKKPGHKRGRLARRDRAGEDRRGRPTERRERGDFARPRLAAGVDQLEGRNVVFEALSRWTRAVRVIYMDERTRPHPKVDALLTKARERGVPVHAVPRAVLEARTITGVHNGVIAEADELPQDTCQGLLSELARRGEDPFFVLVDEVQYEHNLGAILRSSLGAGVNGLIIPVRRGKGLTPVVQRVAMGAAESVPVVREGLSSALATLRRAGVRILGADMGGEPCWSVPMTGPLAVVLGGEGKGLSQTLRNRCDVVVSVPLLGDLESLNVSVTAGILLFEKRRQEGSSGSRG